MLKRIKAPTMILNLGFSDREKTFTLLRALASDGRVAVNLTKARISEDFAWMEFELKGPNPRIHEVAELLNEAADQKDPGWRPVSRAS